MSDAPETIWAWDDTSENDCGVIEGSWDNQGDQPFDAIQYTRTDTIGWQPIETAPKGCYMLALYPALDGGELAVEITRWTNTSAMDHSVKGYYEHGFGMIGGIFPTHWMPLPDDPT